VLEVGRQVGQRLEDEAAIREEQVGNVEVVVRAQHRVAIEEDVDVQGARRESPSLRCAGRASPPERGLDVLQRGEQGARGERRLDRHDAVEEPGLLARRLPGLALPRLGVVEP
jgi:hypothetical protein